MKFLSLIYIFGAIVSPTIAHTDPNVNGAVDAIDQDMSGAPTEMLARRPAVTESVANYLVLRDVLQ
ncbi:hypothetical protein E4U19_007031 [Claviceps sp. Clav32 group G5]|nr:hypothetical protein E4U19_007031 [Claviceps sp. Clav32 group G5]